jgi:hypothetical protein
LLIVIPLTKEIVLPLVVVAVAAPLEPMVTDAMVPLVDPSAEVTVLPMTLSAWARDDEVNIALKDVLVWTCCST